MFVILLNIIIYHGLVWGLWSKIRLLVVLYVVPTAFVLVSEFSMNAEPPALKKKKKTAVEFVIDVSSLECFLSNQGVVYGRQTLKD